MPKRYLYNKPNGFNAIKIMILSLYVCIYSNGNYIGIPTYILLNVKCMGE